MKDTDHNRQLSPDGVSVAFAAFALAHSGCGEEESEFRLDEWSLIGWCRRCDELKVFAIDRQACQNLAPEAGSGS